REDAAQALVGLARDLDVLHGSEPEDPRVEIDRTIHVGDRHPDRVDGANADVRRPRGRGEEEAREQESAKTLHPSRSRRWSPTRSAFAMMVSAGFTAQRPRAERVG